MNNAPVRYGPGPNSIGQGIASLPPQLVSRPQIVEASDTLSKLLHGLEEDLSTLRGRLDAVCYHAPKTEPGYPEVPRATGAQFLNDLQSKAEQVQRMRDSVAELLSALQL